MPLSSSNDTKLRVAGLSQAGPTSFEVVPDAPTRAEIARDVQADTVRKVRFVGTLTPMGRAGWTLHAQLGATTVQPCIVTLEPVTTRVDTEVTRQYLPPDRIDQPEAGSDTEMPEDDTIDPLPDILDLVDVLTEALSIALPDYPRKDGAALETAQFAADGVAPLKEEDVKPFAALAGLREKMQQDESES